MSILYVVGAQAKPHAWKLKEFQRFERAIILEINTETNSARKVVDWRSPAEACPDKEPSFGFKAGTLAGNNLWVCTQTEVLCYSIPDFAIKHYLSLPFFNDLHHVRPTNRGTLLVAVTGLDMVVEIALDGKLLKAWDVLGGGPWERFEKTVDYRKIPTTKPHLSHPNYVFEHDGHVWATRFHQTDAVCLSDPKRRIAIDVAGPHDGHVRGDRAYFTTVNGTIVRAHLGSCQVENVMDLTSFTKTQPFQLLGWCRGIKELRSGHLCVGFSRLRSTRSKQTLYWMRDLLIDLTKLDVEHSRVPPTRLLCMNLETRRIAWEINLEEFEMNSVFSIHEKENPDICCPA